MDKPPRIVFARKPNHARKRRAAVDAAEPTPTRIVKAFSPQKLARLRRRGSEFARRGDDEAQS